MKRFVLSVLLTSAAFSACADTPTVAIDEYARNLYQCIRAARCGDDECRAGFYCNGDLLSDDDHNYLYVDTQGIGDDTRSAEDIVQARMSLLFQNPPANINLTYSGSPPPSTPAPAMQPNVPIDMAPDDNADSETAPPEGPGGVQATAPTLHGPRHPQPAPILNTSPGIPIPQNNINGIHTDISIPISPDDSIKTNDQATGAVPPAWTPPRPPGSNHTQASAPPAQAPPTPTPVKPSPVVKPPRSAGGNTPVVIVQPQPETQPDAAPDVPRPPIVILGPKAEPQWKPMPRSAGAPVAASATHSVQEEAAPSATTAVSQVPSTPVAQRKDLKPKPEHRLPDGTLVPRQ